MRFTSKVAVAALSACLALSLAGCGGQQADSAASGDGEPAGQSSAQSAASEAVDFDGSSYEDTGKGTMYIATGAGETSKKGKVPELAVSDGTQVTQITIATDGMTGKACRVYVDGMENESINPGTSEGALTLSGDALSLGTHKVELVRQEDGEVSVYKSAEYEAVG